MSYIQVAIQDNNEIVHHVGQLIHKAKDHIRMKTKCGILGIPVEDLKEIKVVDEQVYQHSAGIEKDRSVAYEGRVQTRETVHRDGNTKMNQAMQLYRSLMTNNDHPKRADVIELFVRELAMTPAGASTYQQICKRQA